MTGPKKLPDSCAYKPVDVEITMAATCQALMRGDATPDQQRKVLPWIVDQVCRAHDLEWRPDERECSFAGGRRFVGLQLMKFIKVSLTALGSKPHA